LEEREPNAATRRESVCALDCRGSGFMEERKKKKDIKLFEITQSNRNAMLSDILREVKKDV
jgi:nucleoside-triphosphatase THEP1